MQDFSVTTPRVSTHSDKLLLLNDQAPGDILMLTAAVRDLKRATGDRFELAVKTTAPELWANNPYVQVDPRSRRGFRHLRCHYHSAFQKSHSRPLHFLNGFHDYLSRQLGVNIPVTDYKADLYLTEAEKAGPSPVVEKTGYTGKYWVVVGGGKTDFTCKWWNPAYYEEVVERAYSEKDITFVQCGALEQNEPPNPSHVHTPIPGAINLLGQTTIREFVRVVQHAEGVLCPVTFAMHLAAALPKGDGSLRPCVVVAGGREPPNWEAYPGHRFLHNVGALPCCAKKACGKSRCQLVGDRDAKDVDNVCEAPVQLTTDLRIPKCMQMITPDDVLRAIQSYYTGGVLEA